MANYVSGRKNKHQSGSDGVQSVYCDHCRKTGRSVSATKYCTTCDECLCSSCSFIHSGAKLTKHHSLEDVKTSCAQPAIAVPKWQECPEHKGEAIRLFCKSHQALCCLICMNKHHKSCLNTSLIADLAEDFDQSEEFQSFKGDLKKIEGATSHHAGLLEYNKERIDSEYSNALKEIANIAEKAHFRIDELKENTIKIAKETSRATKVKLKQMEELLNGLKIDIRNLMTDIEREEATQQPERIFLAWKNSQSKLAQASSDISKLEEGNSINLKINATEEIDTLLNAKSVLGTFFEAHLRLQYFGEINVKSPSDQNDCVIEGIALLTPEHMIVADNQNKTVKLIDIKKNAIVQASECQKRLFDVAVINDNKVGVTFPDAMTIRVLSADNKLEMISDIKVDSLCLNLVQEQHHGNLIVSNPESLKILDMKGTLIKEISTDIKGNRLFKCPRNIAINPYNSMVYVSDPYNNTVTCLTLDGDVISVYRDADLKYPRGIIVDNDGHVLVGSGDTNTLHVLTWDLLKLGIIPIDQSKMRHPNAFAFCPTLNVLYISSANAKSSYRNSIKMFKLEIV